MSQNIHTTEGIKNQMKNAQDEISNNISEEIEKSEERTGKRIVELIKREGGTEGKQLEEIKMEFINEDLNKIVKDKETEARMFEKSIQG